MLANINSFAPQVLTSIQGGCDGVLKSMPARCCTTQQAVAAALSSSGLYQVLLEGTLLLLSLDPQAYSQEPEGVQLQLADSLELAIQAAITILVKIGEG
jgi:hypothetical protein